MKIVLVSHFDKPECVIDQLDCHEIPLPGDQITVLGKASFEIVKRRLIPVGSQDPFWIMKVKEIEA